MEKKYNSEKILSIKDNIIKTWPEQNFLISIIQNKETSFDWIMNVFVQMYASHFIGYGFDDSRITFYPTGGEKTGIFDLCPYIYRYIVPKSLINKEYDCFSDYVIQTIDNNMYIYNMLDQFFRTTLNGNTGVLHPNYIYGYNKNEEVVYAIDNFENGIYISKKISFSDLNKAYELLDTNSNHYKQYHLSTVLYELHDYNHIFDINLLKELLIDYIYPSNNFCYLNKLSNLKTIEYTNDTYFGIDCYILLENYLKEILSKKEDFKKDLRSLSFLCDHKKLMVLRYFYLVEKKYICSDNLLEAELVGLEKKCKIMLNLHLKFSITNNLRYIEEIYKKLEETKETDRKTMLLLLDKLR